MTTPRSSCPAWCRADHSLPGVPHRWNVAFIGRADGHLEAEVNLMHDDQGPYVQVAVTDHAAPGGYTSACRLPLELAAVWGQIASEMDASGALQVGEALVTAVHTFHEGRRSCRFAWCEADHTTVPLTDHSAVVAEFTRFKVMQFWVDRPGAEPLQYVRLHSHSFRWRSIELEAPEAADLADFLKALDLAELDELAAALRRAAADLGVTR